MALTEQQTREIRKLYTSKPPMNIVKISRKLHCGTQDTYNYLNSLGIVRNQSEAILLALHGNGEWRKLTSVSKRDGHTKLVSIPPKTLEKAGLDVHKEIYGQWRVIGKRKLILKLEQKKSVI